MRAPKRLLAAGAQPHRGDLEDLDSLRSGAAAADGVIHTAFIHDFSKFLENCEIDRRAIEALGACPARLRPPAARHLRGRGGGGGPRSGPRTIRPIPTSATYPRMSEATAAEQVARGACARRWCACRPRSMATATMASCRS